jgi:gamma-glutamylcyclotransferase (GGCT)/AIG2-like uncharacterized protein YtfP
MTKPARGLILRAEAPDLRPLPVFAYGTLLEAAFLERLVEHSVPCEEARLEGFRVETLPRFDWPVLVAAEGEGVSGRIYRGLDGRDLERIDAYEGVAEGLYERIEVEVRVGGADRRQPAFVYLPTARTLARG